MNKQDISFNTDEGRFNYRVGGVVINNDKVLLLTEDRFDFWYLPGGRAYLFETSKEALKREIHEELGEEPVIERILWTTECLYNFDAWNIQHHDLTFYYLIIFHYDARKVCSGNLLSTLILTSKGEGVPVCTMSST